LVGSRFIVSNVAPDQEIQDYLTQRLADLGQHPDIQQQYVGRDNLLTLVAHGSGLTVTSEATTAVTFPGVVYRPIVGEMLPFCAVWSRHNDNPAFRRPLSVARSAAKAARHVGLSCDS
jgi:fructose 1,6-bisphosphatase